MTRAILLCAGYGTRLGELGELRPKPLLPMIDVPIVRYGIALCAAHGIRDIAINVHHHAQQFIDALGDGAALGVRIRYSHEPEILGTGGGIKRALPLLDPEGPGGADEPFVVMNGKLVVDVDLTALLAAHRAAGDVLATLVVRRVPDAQAWSALRVDAATAVEGDGLRVRDVFGPGEHMFCGVHITRPSVIRRLPDGEACSIRQGYLPWLRGGEQVAAYEHERYFAEHSTPRRYLEGNIALLRGAGLRHPPGPTAGTAPGAQVAPSARVVEPARIAAGAIVGDGAIVGPDVVVGGGATVAPGAQVRRVVVWPGGRAEGVISDAIVTARGVVDATHDE